MFNKVENTTYSKNGKTGNIINNDIAGYTARKRVINKTIQQDNKIIELEKNVQELKSMLTHLIEAQNK